MTYDEAINVSIQSVVEVVSKRYGSQDILTLYEGVKKGYNEYVKLIGGAIGAGACAALKQGNKIFTIEDDTPLLHFLTGKWYYECQWQATWFKFMSLSSACYTVAIHKQPLH